MPSLGSVQVTARVEARVLARGSDVIASDLSLAAGAGDAIDRGEGRLLDLRARDRGGAVLALSLAFAGGDGEQEREDDEET